MRISLVHPQISYRALRCIQISTVFFFTFVVEGFLHNPRAGWAGFAVMMIYAGFDNGATLFRAYHRFLGVFLGLLSGYVLWLIGHLDYRTLMVILPLTVFFAFFLVGRAYSVPTVFTVNTSVIGAGYFSTQQSPSVTYYLFDYAVCTLIAFAIILVFEYFWFSRYHMMRRFINDTQTEVVQDLYYLVGLLNQDKIRRAVWFKGCIQLTSSLFEVNTLIQNASFVHRSERAVGDEFNQFVTLTNRIFIGLKALYMANYTKKCHKFDYEQLYQQMQIDLVRLKSYVRGEDQPLLTADGVRHAAPG